MGRIDLDGVMFFAVIGGVTALAAVFVGAPLLVWWLWSHLAWVH